MIKNQQMDIFCKKFQKKYDFLVIFKLTLKYMIYLNILGIKI